jgi:regulator of RNase E activity RraA
MARTLDKETLDFLRNTPTGVINDALGLAGLKGAVVGIHPARGFEDARIAGPALTVSYARSKGIGQFPKSMYDVYYEAEPGKVVVMAGGGEAYSFSGDNQANAAKQHGFEGIVIDGGCRDVAGIRALGMPLYVTAVTTRVNVGEFDIVGVDVPVQIGGILVNAGDIVVADEDGVMVIPQERLDEVVENIRTVNSIEEQMEAAITAKRPVAEIKALLAKKKAKPAK